MICFIKIQSEIMKMTWNISLYIVCMICHFSKCDDFTVLRIISIKQCSIKFIAPLLCNHGNLTLKLHQKKIATLMKGGVFQIDSKLEVCQE